MLALWFFDDFFLYAILAGIISGLLSRGICPELAAYAGVLIHANAGELAYLKQGWFSAEDLLAYVGKVASEL